MFRPRKSICRAQAAASYYAAMFKLTQFEMRVVALAVGMILLGATVRMWRAHRDNEREKTAVHTGDAR
jgi:hypothetical protein